MKRLVWIVGLVAFVAFLLVILHFINRERMGYMFDLAYDPTNDHLYTVAGDRGLYTFTFDGTQLKREVGRHCL